jgi:hypothetical protein
MGTKNPDPCRRNSGYLYIGDTIAPAMTYFRGKLPYNYRQR